MIQLLIARVFGDSTGTIGIVDGGEQPDLDARVPRLRAEVSSVKSRHSEEEQARPEEKEASTDNVIHGYHDRII